MKYEHFTKHSRNELSVLLNKGYSLRSISKVLGKSHSSVSREVSRNKVNGVYAPDKANHKAYVRRYRAKRQSMKITTNPWLEDYIKQKMGSGSRWTPEQIAGRLKFENNDVTVISFKSIYNWLDTVHGQDFIQYLPYKTPYRRKKKTNSKAHFARSAT